MSSNDLARAHALLTALIRSFGEKTGCLVTVLVPFLINVDEFKHLTAFGC